MKLSIKAARAQAGFTQTEVSAKTGWARSTIRRWERYETRPPLAKRKKLSALYGVPEEEIEWGK